MWFMWLLYNCRYDIIALTPDGPEDEPGIKKASEMCKYM